MSSVLLMALVLCASPESVRVSHRQVKTADGVRLGLYRYLPAGGGLSTPPVLVIADAGFGRALMDPLARELVRHNRAVYVAELRGQGASEFGHSLQSIIPLDFPAIAAAIHADRPEPVDLIAHGYFGALALAASNRELQVRRVVALNVPGAAEPPTQLLRAFLEAGGRFSSLASSPQGFDAFEQLFAMASRADRRSLTASLARARDLSPTVAAELVSWMSVGDLPLGDGSTVTARIAAFDRPTLALIALADAFAPAESCGVLRERTAARVELRTFSRMYEGDDFAHVSMLVGAPAAQYVFPEIVRFLQ